MLSATGVLLTAVYAIALTLVLFFSDLTPVTSYAEFGLFLVGVFSPPMFLWLYLVNLQQQKQLRKINGVIDFLISERCRAEVTAGPMPSADPDLHDADQTAG